MYKVIVAVLVVITCLTLVMVGCAQPMTPVPDIKVTVGNKNFTEQYIVGHLMTSFGSCIVALACSESPLCHKEG